MGLYNNTFNSRATTSASQLVEYTEVEESAYDLTVSGAIEFVAECQNGYNNLMMATGICELNYIEAEGKEMIFTEADSVSFIDKLKEFFKNIWKGICSFFAKFIAWLDAWFKESKKFVTKYADKLDDNKTVKMNGYTYTHITKNGVAFRDLSYTDVIGETIPNMQSNGTAKIESEEDLKDLEDRIKSIKENATENADKLRGEMLDINTPIKSSDFAKEIHKYFRNGAESKAEIEFDVGTCKDNLSSDRDWREAAKATYDTAKKTIDNNLKQLDEAKKAIKAEKSSDALAKKANSTNITLLTTIFNAYKTEKGLCHTVYGGQIAAIREAASQAKTVCVKAIYGKEKAEKAEKAETKATGESAQFGISSYISNIEFN